MRFSYRGLAIALLIIACARLSLAEDISFRQAPLDGGDGFFSDPEIQLNADNFKFSVTTKVTMLRWWGTYDASAEPDIFTVSFFADDAGAPALDPTYDFTSLVINRSDSGRTDIAGDTIYQYEAMLPSPPIFDAEATGYISVLNSTAGGWFWQQSNADGSNWFRFDEEDPWVGVTSGNPAFDLVGMTPPPGDYDMDFDVDNDDYGLWRQTFGMTGQLAADGDGNGVVDAADYVVWRANRGTAVGAGASLPVPEPACWSLILAAIVMSTLGRGCQLPVRS